MKKIISIVLLVSLSFIVLASSVEFFSFSLSSYEKSYDKYGLGWATNKSKEEFLDISRDIISYLSGENRIGLMERNFNKREVMHMEDVFNIYRGVSILKRGALLIFLGLASYLVARGEGLLIFRSLSRGLYINYIFVALLVFMVFSDFSKYFIYFHLIFFRNDLWLLDPETDLLIQMMPEGFFQDMAIKIGLTYLILIILIHIFSFLFFKKKSVSLK